MNVRSVHEHKKILLLAFFAIAGITVHAQQRKAYRDISEQVDNEFATLKDSFSVNKQIPAKYEKQILYALSYFPELKQTKIKFRLREGKHGIISTRPTIGSIFRRSSKRTYIVFIEDSVVSGFAKYLFKYSDVNGQTGIVAHELSHVVYFNKRSGLGLLRLAAGHLSRKYIDRFEYNTDSVTILRGFGYQLISWNVFLRKAFGVPNPETAPDPFYNNGKRERYMGFESIRRVMAQSPLYKEMDSGTQ